MNIYDSCQICKGNSKNAKSKAEKLEALRKTIAYCKENDVLREYLEKKEAEVSDMMMSLYTQEEIYEMLREEAISIGEERGRNEGISIGEAQGKSEGLREGERTAMVTMVGNMKKAGLSLEEISRLTGVQLSKLQEV